MNAALPILMLRARTLLIGRYRSAMRRHDISEQQFRILRALQIEDFTDVKALAVRTDLLGSSLSRILRDLAARDLLVRVAAREDARRTLAILTPLGRELITRTMIDVLQINREIDSELGADLVNTLRETLLEVIGIIGDGDEQGMSDRDDG